MDITADLTTQTRRASRLWCHTALLAILAILASGCSLFSFGSNDYGQLATGSTGGNQTSPIGVESDRQYVQMSMGGEHGCGIKANNRLWCWGSNEHGQLGLGDFNLTHTNGPREIQSGAGWVTVAAGESHTCAIDTISYVFCWGHNEEGQTGGNATLGDEFSPKRVGGLGSTGWTDVSIGAEHTCGIQLGRLYCWGQNDSFQLGDGTNAIRRQPTEVSGGGTWVAVAAGLDHTCAIKSDQSLWCWGDNADGQLGLGQTAAATVPAAVGDVLVNWTDIDAGGTTTCAVRGNDSIECWGENVHGQAGTGAFTPQRTPQRVGNDFVWDTVEVTSEHSCATRTNGQLWCWGLNQNLGQGVSIGHTTAPQLTSDNSWSGVAAGETGTCGLHANGQNWCFGSQGTDLGIGRTGLELAPVRIDTFQRWDSIEAGANVACGVGTDGSLWCWSSNNRGSLGLGFMSLDAEPYPLAVRDPEPNFEGWESVTAGNSHVCAISNDEVLYCWGGNSDGQLGLGDELDRATPTQVTGNTNWAQVSAGESSTCAIRNNGSLRCWGYNGEGQLGLGDTNQRLTPAVVGTMDFDSVAGGGGHTCGVRDDGTLWCWGTNYAFQLGLGDTTSRLTPTQVGTDDGWVNLALGIDHSCGIQSDTRLYCWGSHAQGQLGIGPSDSFTDRTRPSSRGPNFTDVAAGFYHTCAIKTDDTLWCWGRFQEGQLGRPIPFSGAHTFPREALTGTFRYVSAAAYHTLALEPIQ